MIQSPRANPEKNRVLMKALFRRNTLCIARKSDEIRARFFQEAPQAIGSAFPLDGGSTQHRRRACEAVDGGKVLFQTENHSTDRPSSGHYKRRKPDMSTKTCLFPETWADGRARTQDLVAVFSGRCSAGWRRPGSPGPAPASPAPARRPCALRCVPCRGWRRRGRRRQTSECHPDRQSP